MLVACIENRKFFNNNVNDVSLSVIIFWILLKFFLLKFEHRDQPDLQLIKQNKIKQNNIKWERYIEIYIIIILSFLFKNSAIMMMFIYYC